MLTVCSTSQLYSDRHHRDTFYSPSLCSSHTSLPFVTTSQCWEWNPGVIHARAAPYTPSHPWRILGRGSELHPSPTASIILFLRYHSCDPASGPQMLLKDGRSRFNSVTFLPVIMSETHDEMDCSVRRSEAGAPGGLEHPCQRQGRTFCFLPSPTTSTK